MPSFAAIAVSTRMPVTLPTSESVPTTTEPWRICRLVGMASTLVPGRRRADPGVGPTSGKGNGNHKQEDHEDRRGAEIEFEKALSNKGQPSRDGAFHDTGFDSDQRTCEMTKRGLRH